MKTFCIRPDYTPREKAETFVKDPTDYWNDSRISVSGAFQYYVYLEALKRAQFFKNCSYLDIGCGYPTKSNDLVFPHIKDVTLIDQPSMCGIIESRFPHMKFIPKNLEDLDYDLGRTFDVVVCADVIEHLMNPDPLTAFIRNSISDRGVAIISTPNREVERGRACLHSPNPQHVREWSEREFAEYLQESGFEILEHVAAPVKKLTKAEEIIMSALSRIPKSRYAGCQMAICKPRR